MATARVTRELDVPADALWKLVAAFGDTSWMPGGAQVTLVGSGPGMERRIAAGPGKVIRERLEFADAASRTLVYTIPDHQNPAGVSLGVERRELLVELARRHGFLIVEDVAYRELSFSGQSLPSLWSLAPDVVVQAGTTSKTFFPGVRLGWAVGPPDIAARLVSAKQNTDQCAGALGQRLFEETVRRGWLDEQLERSRALYRRKCERMLAALERGMPAGARWTRAEGGFFSWLTLPDGADSPELARRAAEQGVGIVPGTLFFSDGRGADRVRLSFSMVDEEQIDDGIERLASLLTT